MQKTADGVRSIDWSSDVCSSDLLGLAINMLQTNREDMLVDWLHEAQAEGARAVLLNAGAYTHTSIALLDAIRAIRPPVVEVHLSDPMTREPFRHLSYVGMAAAMTVQGHGAKSYLIALDAVAEIGRAHV